MRDLPGRWRRFPLVALICALLLLPEPGRLAVAHEESPGPPVGDIDFEARVSGDQEPIVRNPSIAPDLTDNRVLAMAYTVERPDPQDPACGLRLSENGGRTWVPRASLPAPCRDPQVVFDRGGRLAVFFVSDEGAFLTTSDDRAATLSEPRRIGAAGAHSGRLAVEPTVGERGRVYLTWIEGPVRLARSDDGGRTVSAPVDVTDSGSRPESAVLALGIVGAVHVGYTEPGADEDIFWVATSTDAGDHFQRRTRLATLGRAVRPALASGRNQVCGAWAAATPNDSADVLVRCSVDAGQKWREQEAVQSVPAGYYQQRPALSVTTDGRLDVAYYQAHEADADVLVTTSVDAGDRFGDAVRVTAESFGDPVERSLSPLTVTPRGTSVLVGWVRPGSDRHELFVTALTAPADDRRTRTNPLLIPAFILLGVIVYAVYRGWRRGVQADKHAV